MKPTNLLVDFARQGTHIRQAITYLEAIRQDARRLKALHAAWKRATAALIIFNAKPDEAENELFLMQALIDIMSIIDTMLSQPQEAHLPPRAD